MPTTQLVINQQRTRELQSHGFVHVTGLRAYGPDSESSYVIQPQLYQLGKHDRNNGKMVLITEDGEVWLRSGAGITSLELSDTTELYAPNGAGAFVPCSNGEHLTTGDMLDRVMDPFSDHHGSPVPEVKL